MTERERAYGALLGLALGDALGMPTQALDPAVVRERYGLLDGFHPGPEVNPISAGLPAGRVTDDTDQAVIVAELLVAGGGRVDPLALAERLMAWEGRMRAAGSLDLLGPSTRRALDRLASGVSPLESGRGGTTNGAAMRIAPVGIACDIEAVDGLERLIDRVAEVSRPTHNTALAIAGAAAVAAAVSAGVAGRTIAEAVERAIAAATMVERDGDREAPGTPGAPAAAVVPTGSANRASACALSDRIQSAVDRVSGCGIKTAMDRVIADVGTSLATEESVPAAIALASLLVDNNPWLVIRAAASLGGDSDTIAAMAGAIAGAVAGAGVLPAGPVEVLAGANPGLTSTLDRLTDGLFALRRNNSGPPR